MENGEPQSVFVHGEGLENAVNMRRWINHSQHTMKWDELNMALSSMERHRSSVFHHHKAVDILE